jgi:hypothetical protein
MRRIAIFIFTTTLFTVISSTAAYAADGEEGLERIPWRAPRGRALSFAYENGLWGGTFEQGLRVKIPVHPNWGFVLRPIYLHDMEGPTYRGDIGGRLELYGASPVFLNLARIYGGGGVQVFDAIAGLPNAHLTTGGGGHFGFELFYMPQSSFFFEIGGTSGAQGGVGAGGTAIAGVTFYPFAESRERIASR